MDIKHDPIGQKFVVKLDSQNEAVLAYTQVNDLLDMHTLIVPEEYRGIGIGKALAQEAFRFARKEGMKVVPTCPFMEKFVEKHPELKVLVGKY